MSGARLGERAGDVSLLGPIFVREWVTLPRRSRHYAIRAASLGVLWVLGITAWQAAFGWHRTATLGDNARFGQLLFQLFTLVQLTLLLFFSAVSGASAVSQEKDRRTFILLLLTDLRNYEIVLGKVFGSLLQILLLLAGTVPLLSLMLLLGGVGVRQVAEAVLILAATSVAAGSLGVLIALWRERTFQSLALTVLFLVLYLCLIEGLTVLPESLLTRSAVADWQARLSPLRAMIDVLAARPETADVVVSNAVLFGGVMLLMSVLLNGWSMLRLRVWNPSGEPIMQRESPDAEEQLAADDPRLLERRARAHAAPGAVREVWENPILWREIRTRAYGRRPLIVKIAYYVVLALICYYFAVLPMMHPEELTPFTAATGLVSVTVLSLLLIGAQAVTAITSERDTGALDLLLVTDLSPGEFIFGKVLGILYNTKEFLWPPLVLALVYAIGGLLANVPEAREYLRGWRNGEAAVCVLGVVLVMMAFVLVLGIHVALRYQNSRQAIVNTLGTVFFLSAGTLVTIYLIVINGGQFEYQWMSFVFFMAAGIGGLWWVLSADRPSTALTLASFLCPIAVFYTVVNLLVARPGTIESADPIVPFVVMAGAFGFTVTAMLIPLVSEFDVATGRTSAVGE